MNRALTAILGFLALAVLAGSVVWTLGGSFERGTGFEPGSSLRSDPRGTRALYLLLEDAGLRPRRLIERQPPSGALLAVLEPRTTSPSRDLEIAEWVKRGGRLVLVAAPVEEGSEHSGFGHSGGASLAEILGLRAALGPAPAAPGERGPLQGFVEETAAQHWSVFPRSAEIWLGSAPRPVLVRLALGAGQVVALSDPAFVRNQGLREGSHLELALAIFVEPGLPVVFDEHGHGVAEQAGLAYVLGRYGLLPTAVGAVLFLGLVVWRTSPAPGAPPPRETRDMKDSLVDARAALYSRTLKTPELLALLERDVLVSVGERLRLPAPVSAEEAVKRLEQRRPELAARLKHALDDLRALRATPGGPKADGLVLARRLTSLIEEIP